MPFTLTPAEKDAVMTPEALLTSQRRHRGRSALACAAALLATAGATLMSVAPATALTPGRHYEQVTPVDKAGETAWPSGVSADGRRVILATGGGNGLPGFPSFYGVSNTLLAARGETAWQAVPANAPATTQAVSLPYDASADATTLLSAQNTYAENASNAFQIVTTQIDGRSVSLSGVQRYGQPASTFIIPRYNGSTPDFSHVLLKTTGVLTLRPQDIPTGTGVVYDLSRSPSGELVLNNVGADIQNPDPAGRTCYDIDIGSGGQRGERSISDDGQTIFYSASPECGEIHLYARLRAQTTVEVSASECGRQADPGASPPVLACSTTTSPATYANASTDGRRVFFTSDAQLTDSDVDATTDLYEYDFTRPAGHRLLQVSAGGDGDTTPGADAMVEGLLDSADDGSRVYFAAQGVLTTQPNGQGETATAGANNLYRWDAAGNRTTFVTTLDPTEQPWGYLRNALVMGNNNEYLLFTSSARLTVDDTDTAVDVYRYDATSNTLRRISTGQDGYDGDGNDNAFGAAINGRSQNYNAHMGSLQRSASKDGSRIIFSTGQALQHQDVNGAPDLYEWHDGHVDLISDGHDPNATAYWAGGFISADGSTVLFTTNRKLVAGDNDTSADSYVARLGDDFPPAPAAPAPPCVGDVCQGRPTAQAPPASAATVTFLGAGNAAVTRGPAKRSVTVTTPKAVTGARAVLTINAPTAGRLTVSGTGLRSVRRSARAATYRVAVRLTATGARALKKHHRYTTTARVVFTPTAGTSSTARVKLTFKAPATAKGR